MGGLAAGGDPAAQPCLAGWQWGPGVSGSFFSTLAQAGQLLAERGLFPKSAPAGRVAGRAERGEGRRWEGSGGADLAARGSDGGGCSSAPAAPCLPGMCGVRL